MDMGRALLAKLRQLAVIFVLVAIVVPGGKWAAPVVWPQDPEVARIVISLAGMGLGTIAWFVYEDRRRRA
jgi:hypothetical protein